MADAGFDADFLLFAEAEPFVAINVHISPFLHHRDVSDIVADGGIASVVEEEGVFFTEIGGHLAHFQGVGLAHDEENLNGLGHIGGFAIGIREIGGPEGRSGDECEAAYRGGDFAEQVHGACFYRRAEMILAAGNGILR
jgi:hypothetical protein